MFFDADAEQMQMHHISGASQKPFCSENAIDVLYNSKHRQNLLINSPLARK